MKNTYYLLIATAIAFTLSACSSDNDNFDPYKNQVKKPFYPTTITFENSNNDGAKTDKKWQLTYNAEGSIKAYKYDYTIKASNGVQMIEEHLGELTYHKDPSTGNDVIQNSLTVNSSVVSTTAIESYTDKITELVDISNGTIQKITKLGQRTYSNGEEETYKSTQTFTYSDKYCTSSTLTDNTGTTTYTYNWSYGKLNSYTKYQQDNSNNVTQEEYTYTYDNKNRATDYEFNTMAFIYSNMPEIYAAMNLFGITSAYKIEGESYSGYRNFTGTSKPIAPVNRSYSIWEASNDVISYTGDSPSSVTYTFTFSK
jgi:hypothetical protein